MDSLSAWYTQYLSACEFQKGLDEKTLKAYRIDLNQFIRFLNYQSSALSRDSVMEYISEMHSKYKPRTIRRKVASIKAFCSYLEFEELITKNPFSSLKLKIASPLILPRTIPLPVIGSILQVAHDLEQQKAHSLSCRKILLRDVAVLEILFATGMRVSELCSLKYNDVDLAEGDVRIFGKGAKERIIQIGSADVLEILRNYQFQNKQAMEQCGKFFVNCRQKPLSDQSVRNIIAKYTRLAGESLHITPHMFRHSFATLLLEEDVDIRYIQRMLGHSSILTTQIYTYVSGKKQRDILSAKHPRNKLSL